MVKRRSVLIGAGAVAAAVPLAGTAIALAGESTPERRVLIPETLRKRRDRMGRGAVRPAAEFPTTHLAFTHTGSNAGVRLRTAKGWGEWRTLGGCPANARRRRGGLLVARGITGYEIDVKGRGSVTVDEINTVDGPKVGEAAPTQALEVPAAGSKAARTSFVYRSRAAWGADESIRDWEPELFPTQTFTVHHEGPSEDFTGSDWAEHMRALYEYQTVTEDYGDFGYHLAIDPNGVVYEGRHSGDDGWPVFGLPPGATTGGPNMVNGGHVYQWNAGNVGIVLLGNLSRHAVTDAAFDALVGVLGYLSSITRLDPLGSTDYVNPGNGNTKTVRTICAHQDWVETDCPGTQLFPRMDEVRQGVADILKL